jgi:hypothetical protein
LGYKTVVKKPLLYEHHKVWRKQYVEGNQNTDWKKVIFTDSKYWTFQFSYRNNMKKEWVELSDKPLKFVPKDKKQVHAYGGISYYGQTDLVFLSGTSSYTSPFR